jgi:hypothetical protein
MSDNVKVPANVDYAIVRRPVRPAGKGTECEYYTVSVSMINLNTGKRVNEKSVARLDYHVTTRDGKISRQFKLTMNDGGKVSFHRTAADADTAVLALAKAPMKIAPPAPSLVKAS